MRAWFPIFLLADFEALDIGSKVYTLDLEGIGVKDILVTKGNLVGLTYEGIFLPINLEDINPFTIDGHSVYHNAATDQVYLGIEEAES